MGLHVFFGCYFNLFRLMAKCGVVENLLLKDHAHTFVNNDGDVRLLDFRCDRGGGWKGREEGRGFAGGCATAAAVRCLTCVDAPRSPTLSLSLSPLLPPHRFALGELKVGAPFHGLKAFFTTPQLSVEDKLSNALALGTSPVVRALVDPEGGMADVRALDGISFQDWFTSHGARLSGLRAGGPVWKGRGGAVSPRPARARQRTPRPPPPTPPPTPRPCRRQREQHQEDVGPHRVCVGLPRLQGHQRALHAVHLPLLCNQDRRLAPPHAERLAPRPPPGAHRRVHRVARR